ncbi:hypothetical protein [Sedimentisphaera salicampi]|uniref:hypothetical protein n=1 Tax=Sedimentisphaera salicampi TaxID=1941349 RepID=UPI000B9CFF1D|nr:hypothetical protein [Sedimentisphaera salicampi]OXU14594.1 hypothetical protein SMSP1_01599 [Sedimentisphaera salicampi]
MESNSSLHWTYEYNQDDTDLFQGDILVPDENLISILSNVHSCFADTKYIGFMVLTQSCDLVRRKGKCKSKYINICVIRSLYEVLESLLDRFCKKIGERVYTKESKNEARQLIRRILNQNEERIGLFYLYPDPEIKISEHAVAFLRVNVALKADHYDLLLSSRTISLNSEFRSRLGWLIGHIYSRVATVDWIEKDQSKRMGEIVEDLLKKNQLNWKPEAVADKIEKELSLNLSDKNTEEILNIIKDNEPEKFSNEIAKIAKQTIQEIAPEELSEDKLQKIENSIKNNSSISKLFKFHKKL